MTETDRTRFVVQDGVGIEWTDGLPPPGAAAAETAAAAAAGGGDLAPLIDRLGSLAEPEMRALVARVRGVIDEAGSLQDASARLLALYPQLDLSALGRLFGDAMAIADAAGMDENA